MVLPARPWKPSARSWAAEGLNAEWFDGAGDPVGVAWTATPYATAARQMSRGNLGFMIVLSPTPIRADGSGKGWEASRGSHVALASGK
jgi:hypothetical protein